jgi:hypothetical protein
MGGKEAACWDMCAHVCSAHRPGRVCEVVTLAWCGDGRLWWSWDDGFPLEARHMLAGGTAGVLANMLVHPIDTARARITVQARGWEHDVMPP